jgi:hypothetical protein
MYKGGFKMRDKLVLGFVFLLVFGFPSFVCYAQSSDNEQRIVGTWTQTIKNSKGSVYSITVLLNTDGSGTATVSANGKTREAVFTWDISMPGLIDFVYSKNDTYHNPTSGGFYRYVLLPDGRTMILEDQIYRKK